MAITIIKHGRKVYKAVCPTCGCEFLYNDEDIQETKDIKTIGFVICGDAHRIVICPDCNEMIDHEPRLRS